MAYKKLIKVSNVCQLLDKSKYPATNTVNGVTFTNNGDGTIIANGTATQDTLFHIFTAPYTKNHIILLMGCPSGGSSKTYCINTSYGNDYGNGIIKKNDRDISIGSIYIRIYANITVSNSIFKLQLFDLTEMYGVGNEPTTVEQFRQDFPEEMYDYSPHCWLTSYKRVIVTGNETNPTLTAYRRNLTCKTKNLLSFPYYSSYVTKNGITFSQVETYKVHASGINTNNYGTAFDFIYNKVFKAGTYTIKFYTDGNVTTDLYYRIRKDSYFGTSIGNDLTKKITFTLSEDTVLFIGFGLAGLKNPLYTGEEVNVTVWCQIEEGDTATDYVPYGHL